MAHLRLLCLVALVVVAVSAPIAVPAAYAEGGAGGD
jgi:hypothetical protein